jgi:UDP-N-acetylglucosamine 2-epimerase (non-hydrolysing)
LKVVTVLGTRPEIIRLSRVIEQLDNVVDHCLVDTGQNAHASLSDLFFRELGVRAPDHRLQVQAPSFGEQAAQILQRCEAVFRDEKPDRLLLLGDTNSALCSIVAKRMGIPVFHMEAGNRCHDDRVPEETNRRIIDHSSDILLPYTERSRQNLEREGIASERIFVTGNPIREVIEHHRDRIDASNVLDAMSLNAGGYFLVTAHRAENVDIETRMRSIAGALERIATEYNVPVIVSTHPRTRIRLEQFGIRESAGVRFPEPFGFFDFIRLEENAKCVVTDSGTVQEECAIFKVPNVTIRDVTERPETVECGSNIVSGVQIDSIVRSVKLALATPPRWNPPIEYLAPAVSSTVTRIVTGYHHALERRREL